MTKNYPGEEAADLDRPEAFRVNVAADKDTFLRWTGHAPRDPATAEVDPGTTDTVLAHPVSGTLGWLAVLDPGRRTDAATRDLLRAAYTGPAPAMDDGPDPPRTDRPAQTGRTDRHRPTPSGGRRRAGADADWGPLTRSTDSAR